MCTLSTTCGTLPYLGLDGLPLVGVLWHLDNALLLALDDLDDIAELLTWLVDVLGDKGWDKALDDFRDFLDLVEWDLNLNDLLDVPDLRELDDLLDLLEDWLLPDAPLGAGHLVHPLNDTLDWDLLDDLAGLAANTRDGVDLLNY